MFRLVLMGIPLFEMQTVFLNGRVSPHPVSAASATGPQTHKLSSSPCPLLRLEIDHGRPATFSSIQIDQTGTHQHPLQLLLPCVPANLDCLSNSATLLRPPPNLGGNPSSMPISSVFFHSAARLTLRKASRAWSLIRNAGACSRCFFCRTAV